MKKFLFIPFLVLISLALVWAQGKQSAKTPWSFKASYIEACSCRMFCPCYFSTNPDGHFCQFNNALQIKQGNLGNVKLDGMKVWLTGDLGDDFGDGTAEWLVFTFEPSATKEQIDAATKIIAKIYPVKWTVLGIDKKNILMEFGEKPYARLGNGEAEIKLDMIKDRAGKQVVVNNLNYFGPTSNKGFYLGYSNHHYEGHEKKFEHQHNNGFLIDLEAKGEM